jgi:hypothetical protein
MDTVTAMNHDAKEGMLAVETVDGSVRPKLRQRRPRNTSLQIGGTIGIGIGMEIRTRTRTTTCRHKAKHHLLCSNNQRRRTDPGSLLQHQCTSNQHSRM